MESPGYHYSVMFALQQQAFVKQHFIILQMK